METRDPADLRPSPVLKHLPAPAKDSPEVCAMADTIAEHDGVMLPIPIDASNHILTDDGRLRWMGAKRMALTEVPVVVLAPVGAAVAAMSGLVHRAHYTKSALAYLAVSLMPEAFAQDKARRLECLKNGQKPVVHGVDYGKTWEELAQKFGISRALLGAAKQVHSEFERDTRKYKFTVEGGPDDGATVEQTLRDHFEPKILRQQVDSEHAEARPLGLGGVMKALGSIRTTKGEKKRTDTQLALFTEGLGTLEKRFRYWGEFADEDRAAAAERVKAWIRSMPEDLRETVREAIEDLDSNA